MVSTIPTFHTARDRGFDNAIRFLQQTVPQEAGKVKASLKIFDECHQAVQLEMELQRGELIGIQSAVARDAEEKWGCRKAQLELINMRSTTRYT
jgi:hypothetical protein